MKTNHKILLLISLVLLISCTKAPMKKSYSSLNLENDLDAIKNSISESEFTHLKAILDSLPQEKLEGNTYAEIVREKKKPTVFDRLSKRFFKKNRIKKTGKKLNESPEETDE